MTGRKLGLRKRIGLRLFSDLYAEKIAEHKLRTLFWECTLRCNLACRHCGSDCRVDPGVPDMPLADFLKVLDEEVTPHNRPEDVLLIFSGGEVLVRSDLEEAGHLMQLHSHRGGLQGDRDVRGAHIVHPVPVIDIRPREILVSAGNQQHRSIGRPGSIASGEALREPGMSFRIFASRIVICPLLGIVAGRSPACRFEQQCQLFFIDGTGIV